MAAFGFGCIAERRRSATKLPVRTCDAIMVRAAALPDHILTGRVLLFAGLMWFEDLPDEFGNLTSLETVLLVACEIASLPPTITRLSRCIDLAQSD